MQYSIEYVLEVAGAAGVSVYALAYDAGCLDKDFILKMVKNAQTAREASIAHHWAASGSSEKNDAFGKWRILSANEIKSAESGEELCEAHGWAPPETPEQRAALTKWCRWCDKMTQAAQTMEEASEAYIWAPKGTPEEKHAFEKYLDFITTVGKVKVACSGLPQGTEESALSKWIELATTTKEVGEAYSWAQEQDIETKAAAKKLLQLYSNEIPDT